MRTRRLRVAVGAVALAASIAGFWSGGTATAQVTTCPSNTRPWTESMIISGIVDQFTDTRTFRKSELAPDGAILKPTFVS